MVWERFGDVPNYVEPFAGSLAVLLNRPTPAHVETVNDKDAYLANFWRALQHDPEAVAKWADWPVNETDLHARHRWLVAQADFREHMLADPDYFDTKIAGWWVWGICMWIGSGWCVRPEWMGRGNGSRAPRGDAARGLTKDQRYRRIHVQTDDVPLQRPELHNGTGAGVHKLGVAAQVRYLSSDQGINAKRIQLPKGSGHGVHRKLPEISTLRGESREAPGGQIPDLAGDSGAPGRGIHASARTGLYDWFEALGERLRRVRVCCGEWDRILGPSPTSKIGITGVLLDPPYGVEDRVDVYSHESRDLSAGVCEWAIAHGDDPMLRIALCGYDGEHEMPSSWSVVAWKAHGGYSGQRKNSVNLNPERERVWFSPACLPGRQAGLFDELEAVGPWYGY